MWEITGAEFSKSTTHTADGISIRFPRVTRIRDDKDWQTANDLPHLKVSEDLFVCSIFVFLLLPFDFKVSLGVIVSRRFCSRTRELQPVSNKIVVLKQLFSRPCLFCSAFQFWNKEVCVYFFVCLYVISVWLLLV